MVGTVSGSIQGLNGGIGFSLNFSVSVADALVAQTTVTGIKAFLTGGGCTISAVNAQFISQSTVMV